MILNKNESCALKMWEDYRNALAYQSAVGISENIPTYINFYEGRQWPEVTERTKNMPRPVVNIIKMICRNKKSAILSTPLRIVYKSDDPHVDIEKFNSFADYIGKEIGQSDLDRKAISDAAIKGSYFYHYYWDSEAKGMKGYPCGALRCELIDPLNIFFSNPRECDEQKQKWIIIASREEVASLRAKCDPGVDPEQIVPDEDKGGNFTKEQNGSGLCTVLTRYFRNNGTVYCEKATKNVTINAAFPITPNLKRFEGNSPFSEDEAALSLPDDPMLSDTPGAVGCTLYPIVAGNYEHREKSIYGIGEVEGLIPNQKAINFNLGMMLLSAQETAWGKYIVLPDALRGQVISNEPGQILVDWTKTGSGIRKLSETPMQLQPLQLVEAITSLTRTVTGATEVMTGESIGANMSGAAIAQLQSQAQRPIEDLKNAFRFVKEKQGRVLAQFFRFYYYRHEFTYKKTSGDGRTAKTYKGEFSSDSYKYADINVIVEVTSGTSSSAAGDISALESLLSKGLISIESFIKAYPDNALSDKSELIRCIEEEKQSELTLLKEENSKLREELNDSLEKLSENSDTIDRISNIIEENKKLKKLLADIYTVG